MICHAGSVLCSHPREMTFQRQIFSPPKCLQLNFPRLAVFHFLFFCWTALQTFYLYWALTTTKKKPVEEMHSFSNYRKFTKDVFHCITVSFLFEEPGHLLFPEIASSKQFILLSYHNWYFFFSSLHSLFNSISIPCILNTCSGPRTNQFRSWGTSRNKTYMSLLSCVTLLWLLGNTGLHLRLHPFDTL